MSDNQQPKPYDAVLGNQNQPKEGAVVLDGNNRYHYLRVLRGGSWFEAPRKCRSASHPRSHQRDIRNYRGFRVVCDLF